MAEDIYDYDVRCGTCHKKFKVQLFDSHEKNLFLVDKKSWYCEPCKKEYFKKQTDERTKAQQEIGLPELKGSVKQVSWSVKIREELINKVNFLKKSLKFENDSEKEKSDKAFEMFLMEWQEKTAAKWWIDHRKMTVRDIADRIDEISETLNNG